MHEGVKKYYICTLRQDIFEERSFTDVCVKVALVKSRSINFGQ